MKTPLFPVLGMLACLLLVSCVTVSRHPLSSPETAVPDPKLIGSWHAKGDSDEVMEFTVKNEHWMHLEDRKKNRPTDSYDLFATVIDGDQFLNVRYKGKDEDGENVKCYYIIRYKISGDRLTTWWMDLDKTAAAVRSGKLKGTVKEDKKLMVGQPPHPDVDVTLKDSGENIVKLIRSAGVDALFSKKGDDLYRIAPKGQ